LSVHVIIGTYRKRKHIEDCLASMDKRVKNIGDVTIVDDSGDAEHVEWLAQYGKVIALDQTGYTTAYRHICAAAEGREAFVLEEDFTFLSPVDLDYMSEILYHRPYLAQLVLLRGPHFPNEHQHGGLIEALEAKGHRFVDVNGIIEHTACFSANPGIWRGEVFASGWPYGKWSEELKGKALRQQGFRFGYVQGIRVEHHGERVGHGY
jgi:hypothetical protein